MNEADAKAWLVDTLDVSRETLEKLNALRALVIEASKAQNLISAASIEAFWVRHIVDSAQLLLHSPSSADSWLDLGTGAGFPGVVIAMLVDTPVHLVEERRKRHEFLSATVAALGLETVTVHGCRVEALNLGTVGVITARAFAPLPKLLSLGQRFSRKGTVWLLPKGKSAKEELESITDAWQGVFHVEQSITDPESAIIVARGVRAGAKTR